MGQHGFVINHFAIASELNTWKHVVTLAVIGLMSSSVIEHVSLFLEASSATSQAMRRGIGSGKLANTGFSDDGGTGGATSIGAGG